MAQQLSEETRPEGARRAAPKTIARLWQDAVDARRPTPSYTIERDGRWEEVSSGEAARFVDEVAHGLLALGVRRGDAFAILGRNSIEWALFDLALGQIGAIGAPIYANSAPKDCEYILEHSEAVGVLAEDADQLAKISGLRERSTRLMHVLTYADVDDLRTRGREHAAHHPDAVAEAAAAVDPDDLFTLLYTSGTTGPPKACMIRHRHFYTMVACADDVASVYEEDDVLLLYLPLAHTYGRLVHLTGPYKGFTIAFLADPLRVAEALPNVRPTLLPSVPRVYEKIYAAVIAQLDAATGAKRKVGVWALAVGRRVSRLRQAKQPIPALLALQHRIADRLVYRKVKERLGGRLRIGNSGGAPLAREICEFFHALDLLILEGYGLSECTTAATVNRIDDYKFGTVGLPLPGFELKIAEDGEILLRSETVFAGYFKDEAATREALTEDGWLRTGDIGAIDGDGFLTITDRKKDIIVTAGGKNVAPQNLENALKATKPVSQALVVGDRKPYVAALITLDPEGVGDDPQAEVQAAVDRVNAELSRFEQIKRFAILPRDFSAEEGEITPTLKLKRRVCEEHFAGVIETLYTS